MEVYEKSDTYYFIYQCIREKFRIKIKELAVLLGISGRGKTFATASKYLHRMYEYKISLKPALIFRSYENVCITTYFLKVKSKDTFSETFQSLKEDPNVSKVFFLSGAYDFLVTSLQDNLGLKTHGVTAAKKSIMYNPQFTVPHGWKKDTEDALRTFTNSNLEKGALERELRDFLPWEDIHWNIFYEMKDDARLSFKEVGESIGVTFDTVKKHFYESVLPYCDVAHYFFPKGYDNYYQSLILLKSHYEKDLIKALGTLPCTSYVYPLEKELLLSVFHEGVIDLLKAFKKLEEAGFVDEYLLLVPLAYSD